MKKSQLRTSIRMATSIMILGLASQASAMKIVGGANDKVDLEGLEVELYGYARLNASYDIDENISTSTRAGSFSGVNTGADEDNEVSGHFGADAFQSRLGVKATLPQGVKVVIEGDFRGSGGGELRIRHAYGEYMGVMAGRNWSNYNSFVGFNPTLDFDGQPGNPGSQFRTAQLRYTTGPLSVSLEEAFDFSSIIGAGGTDKASLPVLTARLEDSAGAVSYSAAGFVRQIGYDSGTQDDSAVGYGAFGALSFAVTDTVKLNGVINYVNGADLYLYRSGENYSAEDGYVDSSGNLELISGYSASVGASFNLGGGRSINTGIGMVEVDWDDALRDLPASANINDKHETNTSAMINYQWSPVKAVTMGVEYGYYMVDEVDGDDGDASRLMFAAQYNF
ncbi:DcaP family trimeric outer membrane transporter [Marinobacter sp.]|uniref:DcaP family trimeric outer membrane transporter n=1 Tax=Marinobacter sp. TaxID=50741 RepID=UPI003B526A04